MKQSARTLILLLAAFLAVPTALYAQDPYDDLYYSPSKAKEKEKKEKERIKALRAATLPAADSYNVSSDKPLQRRRQNPTTANITTASSTPVASSTSTTAQSCRPQAIPPL